MPWDSSDCQRFEVSQAVLRRAKWTQSSDLTSLDVCHFVYCVSRLQLEINICSEIHIWYVCAICGRRFRVIFSLKGKPVLVA